MPTEPQNPTSPENQEQEATTMTIQQDGEMDVEIPSPDEVVPGNSRKIGVAVLATFVVVVLILFGFALAPRKSAAVANVTGPRLSADPVGSMAPVFSGTQVTTDDAISLADYKGKTVVVNFWASWCTTCKEEAQIVSDVEKKWREKGVVFIGVDTNDTTAGAKTYYQTYGLGYASVQDPESHVANSYGVTGLPETFFINKQGQIVEKYISAIDAATLNDMIAKAVAAN